MQSTPSTNVPTESTTALTVWKPDFSVTDVRTHPRYYSMAIDFDGDTGPINVNLGPVRKSPPRK